MLKLAEKLPPMGLPASLTIACSLSIDFYYKYKLLLKRAELPYIRFHDLRHTFCIVEPTLIGSVWGCLSHGNLPKCFN
jgi:integrase